MDGDVQKQKIYPFYKPDSNILEHRF